MLEFIEIFVQTILAFFAIFFYSRLLGKQQISQLTFYEYVNGITFGSIAATLATDQNQRTFTHFIGLTLFFILTFLMSYVSLKSRPARKLIEGEPTIIIHNGKILENNIRKMRYNLDELDQQLREKDVFNLQDVEFAVAETDGTLSVLLKSDKQPITPFDLNISTQYQGISTELILEGRIIKQNLYENNLDENWLLAKLQEQGISSPLEVFAAILDTSGQLYIDRYSDKLQNKVDISDN